MAKFVQSFLGALTALVIAGCLALGTLSIIGQANQQKVACRSVNQLRSVLVSLVARGERSIPTIKYYKDHPDELARAEAQARSEEQQLQPVAC